MIEHYPRLNEVALSSVERSVPRRSRGGGPGRTVPERGAGGGFEVKGGPGTPETMFTTRMIS